MRYLRHQRVALTETTQADFMDWRLEADSVIVLNEALGMCRIMMLFMGTQLTLPYTLSVNLQAEHHSCTFACSPGIKSCEEFPESRHVSQTCQM